MKHLTSHHAHRSFLTALALVVVPLAGCIARPVGSETDTERDETADAGGPGRPGGRAEPSLDLENDASGPQAGTEDPGALPAEETPRPGGRPGPLSIGDEEVVALPPAGAPPSEGAPTSGPPVPGEPCRPSPFVVHHPESATVIGNALYLALPGGRFLVAPLESENRVVRWPADVPELSGVEYDTGLAALKEIQPGVHARLVRRGDVGNFELIGTADPLRPVLLSSTNLQTTDDDFAVLNGRAYLCADGGLTVLDTPNPAAPTREVYGSPLCDSGDARVAGAHFLGSLSHGRGALVPKFSLFEAVTQGGAVGRVDHGFNPSGNHHYGDIVSLHLGVHRAIVDLQSQREFFVVNLDFGGGGGWLFNPALDLGPGVELISAARDLAWFAGPELVEAYTLADPSAPIPSGNRWPSFIDAELAGERTEAPRLLFADLRHVVLSGSDGLLGFYDFAPGTLWRSDASACE